MPVLMYPYGFHLRDALAALQPCDKFILLRVLRGWDEKMNGTADRLLRPIAQPLFRTSVPRGNDTVECLTDDGILRGFDDGGKQGLRRVGGLVLLGPSQ